MAYKHISQVDTDTRINYIYGRRNGDIVQIDVDKVNVGGLKTSQSSQGGVTPYDQRCTIIYGGYYLLGQFCFVEIRFQSRVTLDNTEFRTMLEGFPQPAVNDFVPLDCVLQSDVTSQLMNAEIDSDGKLYINGTDGVNNGSNYCVGGIYRI